MEDPHAAGQDSPHLDAHEQSQVAAHAAPPAMVIHELVREEGELELRRRPARCFGRGSRRGFDGLLMLTLALLRSSLPDELWRKLIAGFGYSVGFVIVIPGRQQLLTESTVTAVLPLMVKPTLLALLRMWTIVLGANLIGTIAFASLISPEHAFPDAVRQALVETSAEIFEDSFGPQFLRAILAGWLIALMVWLLPSARSARLFVIILLTYVVAIGHSPHIIAGSSEAAFAVFTGHATLMDFGSRFFLPTLLGNMIGGIALVAVLNHAPLASDLQSEQAGE